MEIIETLMDEHRQIERGLGALERHLGWVKAGGSTDRATLGKFVTFLREFADKIHHAKEEELLFVKMAENGFPTEGGPIAVMLFEHGEGRAMVRRLGEISDGQGPLVERDRADAISAGEGYVRLLRDHIQKEDRILYPMAETHLPADAQRELDAAAARLDQGRLEQIEAMQRLLAELEGLEGSSAQAVSSEPQDCEPMGCSACRHG